MRAIITRAPFIKCLRVPGTVLRALHTLSQKPRRPGGDPKRAVNVSIFIGSIEQ